MTAGREMPIFEHFPVMAAEVVDMLAPRADALYIDATFGAGGYAMALLEAALCQVIGVDCDPDACARGADIATRYGGRLRVIHGRFGDLVAMMASLGIERVQGIAFDLGVSSPQLDQAVRGFSFRADGPLDMRMDPGASTTAADAVNRLPEAALADLIWRLGEERASRRIAAAIVRARQQAPILRTGRLAEIIRAVLPRAADELDPATRTFQALRIWVNDELGQLERGLGAAERLLAPGGRLVVVAFHSLEDRFVKDFLRMRSDAAPAPSRHLPLQAPAGAPSFRLITRRPLRPSPAEVAANPRARSARLRAAERTEAPLVPLSHNARRAA